MPRSRQTGSLGPAARTPDPSSEAPRRVEPCGGRAGVLSMARSRRSLRASKSDRSLVTPTGLGRAAVKAFFRVVTTDEARASVAAFDAVATETIRVADGFHRVLARDLVAAVDLPHFNRANMDGYAVRAQDTFGASASIPA